MPKLNMVTMPGGNWSTAHASVWGIVEAIRSVQILFDTERAMQAAVSKALAASGVSHEREVALSPEDRIDFLSGEVGIECKIGGAMFAVAAQLLRYETSDRIHSLILVTSHHSHMFIQQLSSKPLILLRVGMDV